LTSGKVRQIKHYTAAIIDWIAVYDRTSDRCYYCPASELGTGRRHMSLRLTPALNGQQIGIRVASDYLHPNLDRQTKMEPAGLEPATSRMQTGRSSS
jgi:PD-(D/E)XK nuclease superfamily protein